MASIAERNQGRTPIRKPRRGGRLYTGCATCRIRKIKCDERQPHCRNCERSRQYVCNGYDDSARNTTQFTRHEAGESSAADNNVDSALREYESAFGGDLLAFPSPLPFWNPQASDQADLSRMDDYAAGFDITSDLNLLEDFLPRAHQQLSRSTIQNGVPSPSQSSIPLRNETLNYPPESDSTFHRPSQDAEAQRSGYSLLPNTSAHEASELSPQAKKLLEHYKSHVAKLMMPTSSAPSENPWIRLYLPMAFHRPTTRPRQCLLCAILAVAAFNKAELASTDRALHRQQAAEYKEQAANRLASLVTDEEVFHHHANNDADKQALLAAALTMTTVEVFSGDHEGHGYEMLLIAKRIIRFTGGLNWWLADPNRLTLLQIFRCLEIIGYTSGRKVDSAVCEQWNDENASSRRPSDNIDEGITNVPLPGRHYTLDISFGVGMKTLQYLTKIVELSSKKSEALNAQEWLVEHSSELFALENQVFSVLDDPDAFVKEETELSGSGVSKLISDEIMQNHMWAFHYSTAIFFRRALCNGASLADGFGMQSGAVEDQQPSATYPPGQALVAKALEYLENVDALSSDIAVANTLWPGFIAAVEAVDMELRHRALIWFARAKRHGIGNIAKAKALVMEVWRRVDRQTWVSAERRGMRNGLSNVDWREVMREKSMYIMLT